MRPPGPRPPPEPPTLSALRMRALQWLAQREHSPSELRGKLLRLYPHRTRQAREQDGATGGTADDGFGGPGVDNPGFGDTSPAGPADAAGADPASTVDAVLLWLEARGYLSAQRFVESRVNARQARFGNLRIRHELQQHGLGLDAEAQQTLRQTELDRARAVWQRKYAGPAADAAGRARQLRFLAGRGFSADVARRVVFDAGGDPDAADDSDG